jgi:hypothetical protein
VPACSRARVSLAFGSGSCLLAQSSSGAATRPCSSGSLLPVWGSSRATACPHGSIPRLPARGSSGATTCQRGSSTRPLTQGSSEPAKCHEDGLYTLPAIKQILPGGPTIMIFIGARIFQGTTQQGLFRSVTVHAAGGPLNADETCGQTGCRAWPAQQDHCPITVVCHGTKWFNNSGLAARLGE